MKNFGFTGTEPFSKTTRVKPAVIFRLCSNRSVPALLIPDFCTACFLGGGRSILLSYRNVCGFFPYFQGFPAFRVRAPRAPNRPFFIRRFRRFLEISNIVVCSVMEHTTLLDFSSVILPPENRADKFFLPHVRYFLRRRSLYPTELRRHIMF